MGDERGEEALVARVRAGDAGAIEQLYRRFSDRIYALCRLLLQDDEAAADATHDTFVVAIERVGQLRDPERLTAWMLAIARHRCYRTLRERRRVTPADLAPELLVVEADPDAALSAAEAAELVWTAAAGLNDRDRALLFFHLNEGLEGAELAAALGVRPANPYSLLHRAKAQLERSVGVLVVTRFGRAHCPVLTTMLDDWDGTLTPLIRKRVARHIEECAACRATRARALPLSAIVAMPLVAPRRSDALEHEKAGDWRTIAARHPLPEERWLADGFPPLEEPDDRRRRGTLFFVGVVAAGIAIVLLIATALGADEPSARRVVAAQTAPAPQTVTTAPAPRETRRVQPATTVAETTSTTSPAPVASTVPAPTPSTSRPAAVAPRPAVAPSTPPTSKATTPAAAPPKTTAASAPTTTPTTSTTTTTTTTTIGF